MGRVASLKPELIRIFLVDHRRHPCIKMISNFFFLSLSRFPIANPSPSSRFLRSAFVQANDEIIIFYFLIRAHNIVNYFEGCNIWTDWQ